MLSASARQPVPEVPSTPHTRQTQKVRQKRRRERPAEVAIVGRLPRLQVVFILVDHAPPLQLRVCWASSKRANASRSSCGRPLGQCIMCCRGSSGPAVWRPKGCRVSRQRPYSIVAPRQAAVLVGGPPACAPSISLSASSSSRSLRRAAGHVRKQVCKQPGGTARAAQKAAKRAARRKAGQGALVLLAAHRLELPHVLLLVCRVLWGQLHIFWLHPPAWEVVPPQPAELGTVSQPRGLPAPRLPLQHANRAQPWLPRMLG